VVPMVRSSPAPSARAIPSELRAPPAGARFGLGSEWLYGKLFTGTATTDSVLVDVVAPTIAQAIEGGSADDWFFIRFADPHWHLRLRVHGPPDRLMREVLPALERAASGDGRVWQLQLDSYLREVDRYGGIEGIGIAEKIFRADSDAVVALCAA